MKNKLFLFYLIIILICHKINFAMQQAGQQDNVSYVLENYERTGLSKKEFISLKSYEEQLQNALTKLKTIEFDDEQFDDYIYLLLSSVIYSKIIILQPQYWSTIEEKRQKLLRKYLKHATNDSKKIEIQGDKLLKVLEKPLIFQQNYWYTIESCIKDFCLLSNFIKHEEHSSFNEFILKIQLAYKNAKNKRKLKGFNLNCFELKKILQDIVYNIVSEMTERHSEQAEELAEKNKLRANAEVQTDAIENMVIENDVKSPEINFEDNNNLYLAQEPVINQDEQEIPITVEEKATPQSTRLCKSKAARKKEKKIIRNYQLKEGKMLICEPLERPINLVELSNKSLNLEDLFTKTFQEKTKKLPITERETLLNNYLELAIKEQDKKFAFKCIELAPKTPIFLIVYLRLAKDLALTLNDCKIILEYAKIVANSEYHIEALNIINDIKAKITELNILLRIAYFEIEVKKEFTFFLEIFDKSIAENNLHDFIQTSIEINIFKKLLKFVEEGNPLDFLSDIQHLTTNLINCNIKDLEFYNKHENFVVANIKFINAIYKKIHLDYLAEFLIDVCFRYEKLPLQNADLQDIISKAYTTPQQFIDLAQQLISRCNTQCRSLAIECYKLSSIKFDDIPSINYLVRLLSEDKNFDELIIWLNKLLVLEKNVIELENIKYELANSLLAVKLLSNNKVNNDDIIDLLKDNTLKKAKKLLARLYVDKEFHNKITIDPKVIFELIIEHIKNGETKLENYIDFLIRSLFCFISKDLKKLTDIANSSIRKYLQTQDRSLLEVIYKHPLLNQKNGWYLYLKQIVDTWNEYNAEIKFETFLKNILFRDIEINFFNNTMNYNLCLSPDKPKILCDDNQNTVLYYAAQEYHVDLVSFLIEEYPDLIHTKNTNGETPIIAVLSSSVMNESAAIEIIKLFVKKDLYLPLVATKNGTTALHIAALHGFPELFRFLLIDCGANIRAKDLRGYTPIEIAIKCNHNAILDLILANKEQLTTSDIYYALSSAVIYNNLNIFKKFFELLDTESRLTRPNGNIIVRLILEQGSLEIFKYLSENRDIKLDNDITATSLLKYLQEILNLNNEDESNNHITQNRKKITEIAKYIKQQVNYFKENKQTIAKQNLKRKK